MKKSCCLLLLLAAIVSMLAGCAQKRENAQGAFQADDEIVTYQKLDPARTQIVISRTGNITVEPMCRAFEADNPDVQIIYVDITGGNGKYSPLKDWITKGPVPDVVITAAGILDDETAETYFENLSAAPVVQNYEAAALQRTATNHNVYWLPGPSDISAMMYNKTLFAQYGWQVPATFDEFVALCDQIRADTNGEIEPWNPNAKYSNELTTALEAFTYEELFGGLENRTWYNGLAADPSEFAAHMAPYAEVVQTLIEHGILRKEHFTYSATARGKEFAAGKIAMLNASVYMADSEQFDFGYLPFPTTKGELGYLCDKYSCYFGVPKKERTEQQTDAVQRFMAFFSSAEGQRAYIGDSLKVSSVKGVPLNQTEDLAALQPAIDAGHMFALMEFDLEGLTSRACLHQLAADMTEGSKTGTQALGAIQRSLAAPADAVPEKPPEVIAATADMTILDTSFYIADAYREAAGADVGLIANNATYRGNVMRLFAGDVTTETVAVLKPRSFANDAALIKVSMTGQQLLDTLNHPLGNDAAADCIYAYSGLVCEVAPWNEPGSKYLSVKCADGSALQPEQLYTVALWDGTAAPEYITETLETFEGTWETLMTGKIRTDGAIAPADDGRIKLVWN